MTIGLTWRRTARIIKRLKEGVLTISPDLLGCATPDFLALSDWSDFGNWVQDKILKTGSRFVFGEPSRRIERHTIPSAATGSFWGFRFKKRPRDKIPRSALASL